MYKNHLHNTYIYYLSPDSCQRCMISVMRGLARFFIVPGSREARENLKMIHHSLWPEVYSQSSLPMIDPNHFSIGSSTFPYAWRQQTCRSKEKKSSNQNLNKSRWKTEEQGAGSPNAWNLQGPVAVLAMWLVHPSGPCGPLPEVIVICWVRVWSTEYGVGGAGSGTCWVQFTCSG
jgi:hypothetical protein